jgi:hypothetical protein
MHSFLIILVYFQFKLLTHEDWIVQICNFGKCALDKSNLNYQKCIYVSLTWCNIKYYTCMISSSYVQRLGFNLYWYIKSSGFHKILLKYQL